MREIKFRAWDHKNKTMHEKVGILNGVIYLPAGKQLTTTKILMQYTGLKDKNGKEIYEGDVVRWKGLHQPENRTVVFENGSFHLSKNGPGLSTRSRSLYGFEIIGNIYQNSDLLK